ncbi:MAG TPA: hypothetical protein VFV86_13045 [Nitrososphaeraceae archaeon]|nr:hypothetical protein [Nitrososphaeraceae archaeon]
MEQDGLVPMLYGSCRLYRTAYTKTIKEQKEKKTILFWQEKESHVQESVCSRPTGTDNLQNKTQTKR